MDKPTTGGVRQWNRRTCEGECAKRGECKGPCARTWVWGEGIPREEPWDFWYCDAARAEDQRRGFSVETESQHRERVAVLESFIEEVANLDEDAWGVEMEPVEQIGGYTREEPSGVNVSHLARELVAKLINPNRPRHCGGKQ